MSTFVGIGLMVSSYVMQVLGDELASQLQVADGDRLFSMMLDDAKTSQPAPKQIHQRMTSQHAPEQYVITQPNSLCLDNSVNT